MKILVQLKKDTLYFKIKKNLNENQKNILDTNIITDNELTFSVEYINKNKKIVSSFLNELIKDHNLTTCVIYNNEITLTILNVLKSSTNLNYLVLKDDIRVTFKVCDTISKFKNLHAVSCINMPDFMIEILDKKNIVVEMRDEIFFTSKFIISNDLNKYSSLFYKKNIHLEFPFTEDDHDDFISFLNINKYLKIIHINKTIKSDLEAIINKLHEHNYTNIKIIIHENINDIEIIEYIKKINAITKKKNNIRISISYSDKYIKKNLLPQANISILKLCLLIVFIIIIGSFGYAFTNNYVSVQKDLNIKEDIKEIINANENTEELNEIINTLETESKKEVENDYVASLLTLNQDTIGWLKVNNTTIDYPILQGPDNVYYLDHNIKKEYDFNGWIYMDYRNNKDLNDDNTIIYGHTNYNAAVMFGSLKNTLNKEWQNNKDNLIIPIDTIYESKKYQVFSTYTINNTDDYLVTNFSSILDKYSFFQKLQNRSNYDYNVTLDHDDKILTLSTCADGGIKRLVVHAVLID